MFTVNDFIAKFKNHSDKELLLITQQPGSYSTEAIEAANLLISERGGLESLLSAHDEQKIKDWEIQKIRNEVTISRKDGFDISFVKKSIHSTILSKQELEEIIDDQFAEAEAEIEDKTVTPHTIGKAIAGGIIAAVICGVSFGLLLIYTAAYSPLLIIGMGLICYAIIKGITKKTHNNNAVILATVISLAIALGLAYLLYSIVGYKGIDPVGPRGIIPS